MSPTSSPPSRPDGKKRVYEHAIDDDTALSNRHIHLVMIALMTSSDVKYATSIQLPSPDQISELPMKSGRSCANPRSN